MNGLETNRTVIQRVEPHLHHFGDSPLRGGFDTKKARGGFPGLFVCRFAVERNFYPPGRLTAFMKMTYNESINHHVYL